MTVEQIAIRQEVRQMLSEAGITKETMREMVREVIDEEMQKAIKNVIAARCNKGDLEKYVDVMTQETFVGILRDTIYDRVARKFRGMKVIAEIRDCDGNIVN